MRYLTNPWNPDIVDQDWYVQLIRDVADRYPELAERYVKDRAKFLNGE